MDSFEVPLEPDAAWLQNFIQDALAKRSASHTMYFFFDEIQEVPGWETVIRRLHNVEDVDIYLTGSNAFLLSSDLATYLSGRYIEIPIWPLSFVEYLSFYTTAGWTDAPVDELFARYVRFGGMPGLFAVSEFSQDFIEHELKAIRDTVILNDVTKRFELRDIDLLEKLLRYVYSTSGNLYSSKNVAMALTGAGRKATAPTVDAYLQALQSAYLISPCEQTGIGGKQVLRPRRKWYAPDNGLRNREIGFRPKDMGFQLEGVVYTELRRRGYAVSTGDGNKGEVDFVAERSDQKLYMQVCDEIPGEATLKRELSSFEGIQDSFPKILLTRDNLHLGYTESGVRVQGIVDWLLSK